MPEAEHRGGGIGPICRCGREKSYYASQCWLCKIKAEEVVAEPIDPQIESVRDAFEWIIKQSRGEIS